MFIKPPPQENRAHGLPSFPNSVAKFLSSLRADPIIKGGNAANRVKKVKVIAKMLYKTRKTSRHDLLALREPLDPARA